MFAPSAIFCFSVTQALPRLFGTSSEVPKYGIFGNLLIKAAETSCVTG
jgi:hypothetical protein